MNAKRALAWLLCGLFAAALIVIVIVTFYLYFWVALLCFVAMPLGTVLMVWAIRTVVD
jgi:hypothetical protein